MMEAGVLILALAGSWWLARRIEDWIERRWPS
jgi:hypothetical protein